MTIATQFGMRYPLIQGGMANIATAQLAAAVSNAGGLGLVGAGGMTTDMLRDNIRKCREMTPNVFGVNLMLMHPMIDEMAKAVVEEGVKFVTTGAGNPAKYMEAWKAAGITIVPVVPSAALAKRMERFGADAVIVEGCEAGGHIGELTTMALVPQVVDAVGIPVVAAGGIASGRQVLAAFALGASGVQVGTCLLVAEECPVHENYKRAVVGATDTATTVTGRINGVPVRIIKNKMAMNYIKREKEGATKEELEHFTLGSLRRAVFEGDVDSGSVMAGQVAGMCKQIRPCAEIIRSLFAEYEQAYDRLQRAVC
ncbi:MAG: nitronate monooxygenase [Kiritimatiellae bacterium]|nr:nitronate monooxygenase [Kiritimatiellia bacterium]